MCHIIIDPPPTCLQYLHSWMGIPCERSCCLETGNAKWDYKGLQDLDAKRSIRKERAHNLSSGIACPVCGRTCASEFGLRSHLRRVNGVVIAQRCSPTTTTLHLVLTQSPHIRNTNASLSQSIPPSVSISIDPSVCSPFTQSFFFLSFRACVCVCVCVRACVRKRERERKRKKESQTDRQRRVFMRML